MGTHWLIHKFPKRHKEKVLCTSTSHIPGLSTTFYIITSLTILHIPPVLAFLPNNVLTFIFLPLVPKILSHTFCTSPPQISKCMQSTCIYQQMCSVFQMQRGITFTPCLQDTDHLHGLQKRKQRWLESEQAQNKPYPRQPEVPEQPSENEMGQACYGIARKATHTASISYGNQHESWLFHF